MYATLGPSNQTLNATDTALIQQHYGVGSTVLATVPQALVT
jgi:hypothetical protein